jgi:outer membrane murein-binding lipoprotein Lpp
MRIALKMMTFAAVVAIATGCQSTKPLEESIASLKTQVSTLRAEVDTLKRNGTTVIQALGDAQRDAQAANTKAEQAMAVAQSLASAKQK